MNSLITHVKSEYAYADLAGDKDLYDLFYHKGVQKKSFIKLPQKQQNNRKYQIYLFIAR